MKAKFSEFSYGFALTHELVNSGGAIIAAAPEFPSLLNEGKAGGGYDVKLMYGRPLLLQFKLSEYMKGGKSRSAEQFCFGLPYFRFDIRPRNESNQHNFLLEWARRGELVYYASPAFWKPTELSTFFLSSIVGKKTVFINPSAIGPILDNNKHRVVFSPSYSYACFCSEPQDIQTIWGSEALVTNIIRALPARSRAIDEEFFRRVSDDIVTIVSDHNSSAEIRLQKAFANFPPPERASLLA